MKFKIQLKVIIILIMFFGYELKTVTCFNCTRKSKNGCLSTPELIVKYGYPAEAHEVITEDGYILELHRIPHGKNSNFSTKNSPVFIQHGFLGSSADFVLLGPEKALAFLLADAGYDVWLGNFRGNTYSKAHVALTPKEKKFWDFSWHEHGVYDVPASIDYITETSGFEKVIYIGYSLGTLSFLVMSSTKPEYQDKIHEAIFFSVFAYSGNMKFPVKLMSTVLEKVPPVDLILHEELGRETIFYKTIDKVFCNKPKFIGVCVAIMQFAVGFDCKGWPENLSLDIFSHFPAGSSVKTMIHIFQTIHSGTIRQFDYKLLGNKHHYGSSKPPEYDVSKIYTKIHIFEGFNDKLSVPKDVLITKEKLKSIERIEYVNYTRFNHVDFIYSKFAKTLLYDRVLEVVDEIERNGRKRFVEKYKSFF